MLPKVLVVDDAPVCVELLAGLLEAHGYVVQKAYTGTAAYAAVRDATPDLVLLDVNMPDLDGIAVLRLIRSNPQTARIPVILITDVMDKRAVVQAGKLAVDGYLLKRDFQLPVLLERVRQALAPELAAEPTAAGEIAGAAHD